MVAHPRDLWPKDIATVSGVRTPVSILREQAILLGEKTKNIVEAEIISSGKNGVFSHSFVLVAPVLDSYQYELFSVQHSAQIYPLIVKIRGSQITEAGSEEQFIEQLQSIFADPQTKQIIQTLIVQSQP
jgi:hypothetical protein